MGITSAPLAQDNWGMGHSLRLADLLGGLSIVADLGFGLPSEEAMRSCLIGTALARELGAAEPEVADTFYASLLVHVGCTAFSHETAAVFGDELQNTTTVAKTNFADPRDVLKRFVPEATRGMSAPSRVKAATFIVVKGDAFGKRYETASCEVARATARRIALPDGVQRSVYEVHEWWNGKGAPRGLRGEQIALPARLARVAAEAARFCDIGGVEVTIDALRRRSGGILDPAIVDVFVANCPAILAEASFGDPRERILEVEPEPVVELRPGELPRLGEAFGDLADLKTPFTHGHSREVARLAVAAAERLRLDAATTSRLRLAALLHDLGRVGVSNAVWEKPGPLTTAEWEQVRMHAYHSERILATSGALKPLAQLAGMHHERLDGSGYHRGCAARDIPAPVRVLAAADAFQAMTQRRPHREAMSRDQAADELAQDCRGRRLDSEAVSAVLDGAGGRASGRRGDLRPAGLSEREIEVLRLVADGCSNPQIAKRLYISRRTAEHHVQHIYTKIGVSSRAAAALFALEHDLLRPGSDT
jgi:HD-GYP domain-containing protein (c-di-GMP phosphodiesterase class II)